MLIISIKLPFYHRPTTLPIFHEKVDSYAYDTLATYEI